MTKEFLYLLNCLQCAACDTACPIPDPEIDDKLLEQKACAQSVSSMLAYSIGFKSDAATDERRRHFRQTAISYATVHQQRSMKVYRLLEEFSAAQIPVVVLKGNALRDCYAVPDFRISADTDLYIAKKYEEVVLSHLRERNFDVYERGIAMHHSVCSRGDVGILEIHTALFGDKSKNLLLNISSDSSIIREPYREVTTTDGKFLTLGWTDHLIYITLHMIAHYLRGATTIRQMLDVTLYYARHHHRIQADRYWDFMRRQHLDDILNTIMNAVIRYCHLPREWNELLERAEPKERMALLMEDLEITADAGGEQQIAAQKALDAYCGKLVLKDHKQMQIVLYYLKRKVLYGLFPGISFYHHFYPYTKRCPFFILFAWWHRIFRIVNRIILKPGDSGALEVDDRIRRFRKLGLL